MKKNLLLLALLFATPLFAAKAKTKEKEIEKKEVEVEVETPTQETPLSSKDLMADADAWAKQLPKKLSPEECKLLINYLYFNFLTARYDYLIRVTLIANYAQSSMMEQLLVTNEDEALKQMEVTMQRMAQLHGHLVPVRIYANQAAQACFEHIGESKFTELKKVIAAFQEYSKKSVDTLMSQDWPKSINRLITRCVESLEKDSKLLPQSLEALQEAVALDANDEEVDVATYAEHFQQVLKAADLAVGSCFSMAGHAMNIRSMAADITNIQATIYNIFYNSLFKKISTKKEKLYILFDEDGLIDEDEQDELLMLLDEKFKIDKKHFST